MFHIKSNTTYGVAVILLIMSTAAFAGASGVPAAGGTPDWLSARFADDSPDAIKQRSAPGDPVAGKDKSELCTGCHGEDGNSAEPLVPKLAGQYGKYIAKELRNYQAGTRSHQVMSDMAATITDADLADISAYFASQKKMRGNGPGKNSEVGKHLFTNGDMTRGVIPCTNCHGVDGKGRAPSISMFPVLGGQQKGYLQEQLINFKKGERSNSPNAIMNRVAKSLSDAEIESLADYLSGL